MTNEFFAFSVDTTIEKAAITIRDHPGVDVIRQVFILNRQGQLEGYVPERSLIINPGNVLLQAVMTPVVHTVSPEASREEVVDIVERYKLPALPVVDAERRLVGLITSDDVLEALEDIADDTLAQIAGTGERVGAYQPTWKRMLSRAPWLVVTLCGGFINVGLMSSVQEYRNGALTFVLFFVPLITGLSGNIGIQCSTVLVRSMATGTLSVGSRREAILQEVLTGVASGMLFGCLAGVVVWSLNLAGLNDIPLSPAHVGLIVGAGLWGACLASTCLGVFSPLVFARIGVDPAVAAGPIVTTFNDFLSISIYFVIALGLSALVN